MVADDEEPLLSADDTASAIKSNGIEHSMPVGAGDSGQETGTNGTNAVTGRRPIRSDARLPQEPNMPSESQNNASQSKRQQRNANHTDHHHRSKRKHKKNDSDIFTVFSFLKKNKQTLTYVAIAIGMAVSLYPFMKYQLGWSGGRGRGEKSPSKAPRRMGPENKKSAPMTNDAPHIPPDMLGGAHHHMHPAMGAGRGAIPESKGSKAADSGRRSGSRGGFGLGSLFGGGMGSLYSVGAIMFALYSFAKVFMRKGKNKLNERKRRGRKRRGSNYDSEEEKQNSEREDDGDHMEVRNDDDEASNEDETRSTSSSLINDTGDDLTDKDETSKQDAAPTKSTVRKRKTTAAKNHEMSSAANIGEEENEAENLRRLLTQAQQRLSQLEQKQAAETTNPHEKNT